MTRLTGFAEACYDNNSIEELRRALKSPADKTDMETWGISELEYFQCIRDALEIMEFEIYGDDHQDEIDEFAMEFNDY